MSLDEAFQAGTDAVARDMIRRPQPVRPEPAKFSIWRTTTAAPRGAAAGVAESTGMVADVLGAFGQIMAATDARSSMFSAETATQRVQNAEASAKLRASGPDFSSDAGELFRDVSRGYRPDPLTAHAAESLVFDASRVITKAVGYSVAAGPFTGAALTGVDEGMQVSDDLKAQGVDLGTRTAVGAVQGLGTAVGVVAPIAGKTIAGTAGLVVAAGPGAFIAQQSASREILQRADYSQLTDQYDPLDPVGLAVSILVPAAFGAYALRGARRAADRAAADTSAPAQPLDAPTAPSDQVDAARVALQVEDHQAGSLAEPTDIAGQSRHDDAVALAEQQLGRGETVKVSEVVDNPHADAVLADFSQRVRSSVDDAQRAASAELPDPFARAAVDDGVRASQVLADPALNDAEIRQQFESMIGDAGWAQEGGKMLRAPLELNDSADGRVIGRTQWIAASEWYRELQSNEKTNLPRGKKGVERAIRKALDGQPMTPQERRAARFMLEIARADADPLSPVNLKRDMERAGLDATADDAIDVTLVARASEIDDAAVEQLAVRFENDDAAFMRGIERLIDEHQNGKTDAGRAAGQPAASIDSRAANDQGAPAGRADRRSGRASSADAPANHAAASLNQLADIQAQHPDLAVMLDGMDAPMRLSDFLDKVQREADADVADAPLYQLAAECAIVNGT